MDPIKQIINKYRFMILDGGEATELESLGCDLNDPLWSSKILLEDQGKITNMYNNFLAAGADCIGTITYQATYPGFKKLGYSNEYIKKIFEDSVKIAFAAREKFWESNKNKYTNRPKPIIAGSIGSYGAFLTDGSEYTGNYNISYSELYDFHLPRISDLVEVIINGKRGIDILAFETIPSLEEAKILVEILQTFPAINAWLSFSIIDEMHISEGNSFNEVFSIFKDCDQISAIGVNCTSPGIIDNCISNIRSFSKIPVIVYPNSGEKYLSDIKKWTGVRDTNKNHRELAKLWYEKGAGVIGGCCRTTPEQIKMISDFRSSILHNG